MEYTPEAKEAKEHRPNLERSQMERKWHDENSDHSLDWEITKTFDDGHEAQINVGGYKYPHPGYGNEEPYSNNVVNADLTIGHRWGNHLSIDLSSVTEIDTIIDMLQEARTMFYELGLDFPRKDFKYEEFKHGKRT